MFEVGEFLEWIYQIVEFHFIDSVKYQQYIHIHFSLSHLTWQLDALVVTEIQTSEF